jgi:pimeloyl-ACP methyl ester carboxylesterase
MNTPIARKRLTKSVLAVTAAATLAVAVLAIRPQTSEAATPASASANSSVSKPTIVLVHGAWADGSSFAPETAALQLAGYKVLLAPNPLRGEVTDAGVLENFLAQKTSGPVVLVGHSYGGVVISSAATGNPNVKALVYVDAYAPDTGESASGLTGAQPGSLLNVPDPSTVFDFVLPTPDASQGDWDAYIKTDKFQSIFAASLPKIETDVLAAGQSPVTLGALATPFSGEPAWKTIPSWFFIGTADKVIPAAEQRIMAARAHGTVVEANAPHLSMLAKPLQVTNLIIQAAKSVH